MNEKIKTVWHWNNIGKCALVVVMVGAAINLFQLPPPIDFFVGMVGGVVAALFSLSIWDLWHFE